MTTRLYTLRVQKFGIGTIFLCSLMLIKSDSFDQNTGKTALLWNIITI